jgi:hypothetical protein
MKRFAILTLLVGLMALPLLAQNPTGTLTGHVTDGKTALPGVTVIISSPNMQGTRTAVTTVAGDYILTFLPPGEYKVRFELQGFQTLETSIKVSAAQTSKLDAEMPAAKVAEEVTVTGSYETIAATQQASTTYEAALVGKLPLARDMLTYIFMSPAVTENGPGGAPVMGGGNSFDNLFMINGVTVNENVRGSLTNLFIEDAIQESTTTISGVSAEYGRFAGGLVNTLTKSGGNQFSGSFRDTVRNNYWTEPTPLTTPANRADKRLETYEATLGGFMWKDHIWFFGAWRKATTSAAATSYRTGIGYNTGTAEKRWEGKLTLSPTPEHRLVVSYIDRTRDWTNYQFAGTPDPADTGIQRSIPETLKAGNYTGVLSENFFIEGQYSERNLTFLNAGSPYTDILKGTVIGYPWPAEEYAGVFGNSSVFCAQCGPPITRNNKDYLAKGSWFLTSQSLGSHDVRFGVDQYHDQRQENNFQSGSGYFLGATAFKASSTLHTWYPQFLQNNSSFGWTPVLNTSIGTDFQTSSAFVNDVWRLNNKWSFNLGLRFDKNGGHDESGRTTAKDSMISPRLGATFDPGGDGHLIFNASFGKYVAGLANTMADQAGGGNYSQFEWLYTGPSINATCNAADPVATGCVDAHTAIQQLVNWYTSNGALTPLQATQALLAAGASLAWPPILPSGLAIVYPKSLRSPTVTEFALSATRRLGTKGTLRADLIHRSWSNFYVGKIDATTGSVELPLFPGQTFDRMYVINSDKGLEHTYDALMLQSTYRFTDAINGGFNYTLSRNYGNAAQENYGSGPILDASQEYPEYFQMSWLRPKGLMQSDQEHRLRVYGSWDVLNTKYNRLSAGFIQSFYSGGPYGFTAFVPVTVANAPAYKTPPTGENYWVTKPDAYNLPSWQSTDLNVTYAFHFPALGKDVEIFIAPIVTNVFNRMAVTSNDPGQGYINLTAMTAADGFPGLVPFDPFKDKPKQCTSFDASGACTTAGANWVAPTGTASASPYALVASRRGYQTPRTYYISFGIRF